METFSPAPAVFASCVLAATMVPITCARAQAIGERSPLDVANRQGTTYLQNDEAGFRAGAFRLRPNAAVSMAYDSNIFASTDARSADALHIAEALVEVANDPGVLDLDGAMFVRARRYLEVNDQDTLEYGLSGGLIAHAGASSDVRVELLAQRRFELRTDVETPDVRAVSFYREFREEVAFAHTFNRLTLKTSIDARQYDYEEHAQDYRDMALYGGAIRGDYDAAGSVSLIGTLYFNQDDYRQQSEFTASASTTGALVGASATVPEVIELELLGGYFRRTFAEDLGEISGLSLRGSLTFHPTRLTSVRAELVREDAPTRLIGALGKIRTDASIAVAHEYSRSLSVYARARMTLDNFDTDRSADALYESEVGAVWAVSRNFVVATEYDYAARDTDSVGETFSRHILGLSIIGKF